MKKILIITYDWMPRNSIAVHRPYAWAKYWKEIGVDVTVLTSKKCSYDEPLDLKLNEIKGVQVIEVAYRNEKKIITGSSFIAGFKKALISFLKKNSGLFQKFLSKNYDIRDSWADSAIPIAINLHDMEKFDIIISTFGPRSCHFIAKEIKIKYPSVVWLADYRDMWSIRHNLDLSLRQKENEKKIELSTVNLADYVTTVSHPLAIELSAFLQKKVSVVYNGYDSEFDDFKSKIVNIHQMPKYKKTQINIVYTGIIYPGFRDPTPLFVAINNLIEQKKIRLGDVCVNFYGHRQLILKRIIDANKAASYAVIHGHVERKISLELQSKADLLLLLESGRSDAKGVVTGKIFEYMISGSPVLSLGSTKDSAIGELIKETGVGVVCGENVKEIESALLSSLEGKIELIYKPNLDAISTYSRKVQSLNFINCLLDKIEKDGVIV